ncbi:MAG TPA: YihY/virulence factor BrkB family protein [Burkholderiales bacterium]|jgi:membrane protein
MDWRTLLKLCRQAVTAWIGDYAPSMGAAIAYYTVFSIAPLLLIVIAIGGAVFGREAVQGQIVHELTALVGESGATAIQGLLESASNPAHGILATVISIAVLAVGATTVFSELQSALDRIWRVPVPPKQNGVLKLLRTRLLSFGLILGLGFLLLVSLVVSAALAALGKWSSGLIPGWESVLQMANTVVGFGLTTVLFAMIYKIMPRASIAWADVWIGAGVTAALFEVGKVLIGLYIGKSSITSGLAAAGSLLVLLVWVYYSAQIFLLGAEFTWVFAHHHGSHKGELAEGENLSKTAAPSPRAPQAARSH